MKRIFVVASACSNLVESVNKVIIDSDLSKDFYLADSNFNCELSVYNLDEKLTILDAVSQDNVIINLDITNNTDLLMSLESLENEVVLVGVSYQKKVYKKQLAKCQAGSDEATILSTNQKYFASNVHIFDYLIEYENESTLESLLSEYLKISKEHLKVFITKERARQFLVNYHGFNDNPQGKQAITDIFKRLGCIQYDPLNVVGRNPDLVLQSRIKNYKPEMLYQLLYKDRLLLDGWDKQMSIYSVDDYPFFYNDYYLKYHLRSIEGTLNRRKSLDALNRCEEVIDFLKENGRSKPKGIDLGTFERQGSWGHNRYSSVCMDYLYNKGQLVVAHKEGVQKVYDLTSNHLSSGLMNKKIFNDETDLFEWHLLRRVGSLGLIWNKGGGAFLEYYLSKRDIRLEAINTLVNNKLLTEVHIKGIDEKFYIRCKDLPLLKSKFSMKSKMSFLAPLDNMIWDRKMVEKLFDFKYSWEVYVPAVKRKYGYYVLPVLYKDQIIARFEPVIDKESNQLVIKNWWYQNSIKETKAIIKAKNQAITRFCKYLNVKEPSTN